MNARVSHLEGVLDIIKEKTAAFKEKIVGSKNLDQSTIHQALLKFDKETEAHGDTFEMKTLHMTVKWNKTGNPLFEITKEGEPTLPVQSLDDLKTQLGILKRNAGIKAPANLHTFTAAVLRQQARAHG